MSELTHEEPKIESWEVLDVLSGLVEKNLISVERDGDSTRYRLLETVRQYARDHLLASGRAPTLRMHHAEYFCDFAETAGLKLRGHDRLAMLDALERDIDNVRASIDWSTENSEAIDIAWRLCHSLQRYWDTQGHAQEGLDKCRAALVRSETTDSLNRARCLNVAGCCARSIGEMAISDKYLRQALDMMRRIGDRMGEAILLNNLGYSANVVGKTDEAETFLTDAIAIYSDLGEKSRLEATFNNLGDTHRIRNDTVKARQCYENSLAICKEFGDLHGSAINYLNLGDVCLLEGDLPAALEFYEKCRDVGHKAKSVGEAFGLMQCGDVFLRQGNIEKAELRLRESVQIFAKMRTHIGVFEALSLIARVSLKRGDPNNTIRLLAARASLNPLMHHHLGNPPDGNPLEEARSLVDRKVFDQCWAEGSEQSFDQIVQLALS